MSQKDHSVVEGKPFQAVESHSCALTDQQLSTRLSCWAGGENFFGQLGDNSTNTSAVPVQVATNLSFEAIVGAWPQSCWEQAGVLRPLHLQECRPYYASSTVGTVCSVV